MKDISHTSIKHSLLALGVVLFFGCKDSIMPPPADEVAVPSDIAPAWSPNGKWVAYYHEQYENDTSYPTGLYLVDTSGNNRRLLVPGYASSPDWSPDGRWIAFHAGAIYAVNFEGDSIRQITPFRAFFPSWSPDGEQIAFDTPYQDPRGATVIWIINPDGTDLRDISQHGVGEWRMPAWSPDGGMILHLRYLTGVLGKEIFLMDTTGNNPIRLTNNNLDDRYPRWARNGGMIAWTVVKNATSIEVWLMDSNGGNQRKLTDGQYCSFSPDSRMLVVSKLNAAKTKYVLWIINVDGSNLRQMTH